QSAGDFRAAQQFAVIGGDEIGADARGHVAAAVGVELGDADPLDRRMACRHLAAKQPDATGADDCQADAFCRFPHARHLALISATAESAWFDSGRSTGSPRSADKSAAM